MPAAIKRRKVSATKSASANSNPLIAYTRVSKASSVTKTIIKNNYVDTIAATSLKNTTSGKKRTLDVEEGAVDHVSAILSATIKGREIKALPQRRSTDVPQTSHKLVGNVNSPPSIDTPTKRAQSPLDRLHFSSKTPTRSPLIGASHTSKLDPETTELPNELLDLINMHASFLTALSLHYAHNGTHSPADLRILCPGVARAWGKRRVTFEDIRRTLGVMNTNMPEGHEDSRISRLSLSDYGHGKICVEIRTGAGKAGTLVRPVNENLLNKIYVRGLKISWEERAMMDMKVKEFVESLPLEPITTCSSLTTMSPLLAKGQRRLEDIRAGAVKKETIANEKVVAIEKHNGSKPTLLERLQAKQLERTNKAPPPTKSELSRRQALQRMGEVVSVLNILTTSSSLGQTRISFTMPTVLSKLQDSFKTPISSEEADICVRLLASEIAPEWVRIVKMGKLDALAVNRDERPTGLEIEERVKRAT